MFSQLLNAHNDPVFLLSLAPEGLRHFLYANDAAITRYGYSLQQFRSMGLADISVDPDMLDIIDRDTAKKLSASTRSVFHARHLCKSGSEFPVEICCSVVELDRSSYYLLIVKDLSGYVDLQTELDQWKEKFKTAFHLSPDSITLTRLDDGLCYEVNEAFSHLMGYQSAEVVGKSMHELNLWNNLDDRNKFIASLGDKGVVENLEAEFVAKDGTIRTGLLSARTFDFQGEQRIFTITRDIAERKQAEEEMRRMSFAMDHFGEEVHLLDESGRFAYVNQQSCTETGYTKKELIGMKAADIIIRRVPANSAESWSKLWNAECLVEEVFQRRKDGTSYPVEVYRNPFVYGGSRYGLAFVRNIEERKKNDKEMKLMTFALDHIDEEVHLVDAGGHIVYVNKKSCEMLGYSREELLGMSVPDIACEREAGQHKTGHFKLMEHKILKDETNHRRKDGQLYPVEVTANFFEYDGEVYNLALVRDITERKRNEEERRTFENQMVQAQKMESLAILAGGVAHDFNNLVAAILGQAELTRKLLPEGSVPYVNLGQIEIAAERAAELAGQMLAYSGRGQFVIKTIDLNLLLDEILRVLKVSISNTIDLHLNPGSLLPGIDVDVTQIRQIVMNLIINAAEAIGADRGDISIVTRCVECPAGFFKNSWFNKELAAGPYVSLEVIDSGCGMDEETLSKVFDPFFTTKFAGRGLGMSAVLGIVRGHKGAITVTSKKGEGTSFQVFFPASEKRIESIGEPPKETAWQGSGTVLLVDDEEVVRTSCSEMLKALGFTPLTANDGVEALERFKETPEIRVTLLDFTMPHLNGEECFYQMRTIDPDAKVILSSGYSESEVSQRFKDKGVDGFLQKPYRLAALIETIRNALGE
jgi:PAS domain S-box-containing protein